MNKKIRVLTVFGTRPEAIKMCPLVKELQSREEFETIVCVTGQHKEMLESVLDIFNIIPDINLEIMKNNQTLFDITTRIINKMKNIFEDYKPDIVLVHGDTTTTFATSLAAFYSGIRVGHVEAGLRTYNINSPYPEEFNRRAVSLISTFNFSPTTTAKNNLTNEGVKDSTIFVTGNTAIDALKFTVGKSKLNNIDEWLGDSKLVLLTAHRRENLGINMKNMFKAINRIVNNNKSIKVLYPIHLNPNVRKIAKDVFGDNTRIKLIEPLNVVDFHNLLAKSYIILTDSGGIQEEAPSLGVPVLVMRDTTERPEGVESGTLKVVGTDEENIYDAFMSLISNQAEYDKMSQAKNPYGDGTSSIQIADILIRELL